LILLSSSTSSASMASTECRYILCSSSQPYRGGQGIRRKTHRSLSSAPRLEISWCSTSSGSARVVVLVIILSIVARVASSYEGSKSTKVHRTSVALLNFLKTLILISRTNLDSAFDYRVRHQLMPSSFSFIEKVASTIPESSLSSSRVSNCSSYFTGKLSRGLSLRRMSVRS